MGVYLDRQIRLTVCGRRLVLPTGYHVINDLDVLQALIG